MMVEAAGVEPASETTFDKEHSCFSRFILSRQRRLERAKMRRRPAWLISLGPHRRRGTSQPTVRRSVQAR